MRTLDDKEDPNFGDGDYLLAAYASSLKVLTSYKNIEGMDIQYELSKDRKNSEPSPVERMIRSAVKIAYDYLIPANFDSYIWKLLSAKERFYIKGLEVEKRGSTQLSTYQELARGFGVNDYKDLLADARANNARLKTANEFKMTGMQNDEAKVSTIRNILVAIHRGRAEEDPAVGKNWLRNELQGYWDKRESIIEILTYITELENHDHMQHWLDDAHYARLIRELVKSDGY
jgi:putative DNA methylase